MGKVNIRIISQTYGKKSALEKRRRTQQLLKSIDDLQSSPNVSPETSTFLKEQRNNLNNIYAQDAKGAYVRSRFQYENEGDSCSSFFFNLEKHKSSSKTLHAIKLNNGTITQDPAKVRNHIHSFYTELYKHAPTSTTAQDFLLSNLPSLDSNDSETCDRPISVDELDQAVKQLNRNKTPGLDGLTCEFYQCFWPLLKNDFYQVLQECIEQKCLPLSIRRAVISLLPKKGDLLEISNWRPVSLLNTDYKILAKVLANRLKSVINDVVQEDQSYSVPDRSIYDNISIIRDSIMYANQNNLPLAICNLDQKKAFDSIDHDYLFQTLRKMGFGEVFISLIRLLYTNVTSLIKVQSSLTAPLPFERGIRQGCPLSGLLYSVAIEPLLHTIRQKLALYGLPLPGTSKTLTVSAYADDVTLFVTSDRGFDVIKNIYTLYSRASSANLNLDKCRGLWVGSWATRPDNPLAFQWNNDEIKCLGVHLGNAEISRQKNWKICKEKLTRILSLWSGLAKTMSIKGRIIVTNQIASSKLLHFLAVLPPSDIVLNELQDMLINFVWLYRRHWLSKNVIFQPPKKGGLGLVSLKARVLTFRFNLIQRLFRKAKHPAFYFFTYYLRMYHKLGYDFQLFYTKITKPLTGIPVFYSEVLKAWDISKAVINTPPESLNYIINLPIHSLFLCINANASPFMRLELQKIGHLLNRSGTWRTAEDIITDSGRDARLSSRILQGELSAAQECIINAFPNTFNKNGARRPPIEMITDFYSLHEPPPDIRLGDSVSPAAFHTKYVYSVINAEVNTLPPKPRTPWHNNVLQPENTIPWTNIYRLPVSKKEGDIQYRLIHKILPSQEVLHHLNPSLPKTCGWCGPQGKGDLLHLFFKCPHLQPALQLLHSLIRRTFPNLKLDFAIFWCLLHNKKGPKRRSIYLCNYFIISLKATVYWLYINENFKDILQTWKYRMKSKMYIEFNYYKLKNDVKSFIEKWDPDEKSTLFTLNNENILWNF